MELFNDKIRRIFQPFAGITGGRNGIYDTLKDMFKDVLQEMSEAEMDVALGYGKNEAKGKDTTNIRNGYSSKNLKTKFGNIEMDIPRDRNSEFEPMIVPKYQRNISGIEAVYPKAYIQRRIIHQFRNSFKYVGLKTLPSLPGGLDLTKYPVCLGC